MLTQHACLLTDEQVQTIHESSLTILEDVGLHVRNAEAREIFRRHGCRIEAGTGLVRFPPAVVQQWRQTLPPEFRLFGRVPRYDLTLPDDGPVISAAGVAPDVLNLETGRKRRATVADVARIAHLVNELPGIDILPVPVAVSDVPE